MNITGDRVVAVEHVAVVAFYSWYFSFQLLVDGGTVQRGEWEGLSAIDSLQAADSGSFLEASGDLIQTGPTGTNVMDLVIAWKW